ncbi:hypothetical protein HYX00_03745 [Candidatus Woesearchaeota archaeon]|nr:hypothetical protein [Candidatus Woesearchaeota archaeon]
MTKRALIGLHTQNIEREVKYALEGAGYKIERTGSVDEVLEKMGIPQNSAPDVSPTNPFEMYVMDVNFGSYGDDSCAPSLRVFQHVRGSVKKGDVKFLAISGNATALRNAEEAGIPCKNKDDLVEIINYLRTSQ